MQPEKGELPYELAEKKPLAFYREVMESNVKEHKVSSPMRRQASNVSAGSGALPMKKLKSRKGLTYQTSIRKRSIAYILNTIHQKLQRLISNVTEHSPEDIQRALSNPEAEQILQR